MKRRGRRFVPVAAAPRPTARAPPGDAPWRPTARGRNPFAGGRDNPLTTLFLLSVGGIGLTVPLVIAAAEAAAEPTVLVLGMAIPAGVVWIPYGWAAGDPVGLRHAVARGLGCYAAYAVAPDPLRASLVCAVVAAAYVDSLSAMKRPGAS